MQTHDVVRRQYQVLVDLGQLKRIRKVKKKLRALKRNPMGRREAQLVISPPRSPEKGKTTARAKNKALHQLKHRLLK